jgi:hypothetical protein
MPVYPAEIYNKGSTDKTLILAVRAQMIYPFEAPNWTDLRLGFFLSLTQPAADDTITGLAEAIANPADVGLNPEDRYWIGIKTTNPITPKNDGAGAFIGFTNASHESQIPELTGDSILSTSDGGVGTVTANFWRPNNSSDNGWSGGIWEGPATRAVAHDGVQQHFPQDAAGAGGYAVLLALRIRRPDKDSKTLMVTMKVGAHSGDILYTNTPTLALLQDNLENFPGSTQQWGPVALGSVPDAFYCYWPFYNSRLRIHALGLFQAR